ncbi:MAG TPA: hypothetical protein VE010_01630 [Thermoanaerobaculia bacterium]|nr:hypothetical protein [Thermoanaerobaculia bacterium]
MSFRTALRAPLMHCALFLAICTSTAAAYAANLTTGPSVRDNNASCDIGVAPAATLLLPYFEVADSRVGETTMFTITNVTSTARIARVTLWTDKSYPVLSFDIYLTGYDVQSVDLYDVIGRGIIGDGRGTGTWVSPVGEYGEHNPRLQTGNCGSMPADIEPSVLEQLQDAFRQGIVDDCNHAGAPHENFVGFATIDVVRNCVPGRGPADPRYWTEDILFDNVLIGDYVQLNATLNLAQGNPMVHIRAVPEGGTPRSRTALPSRHKPFERTFYGRFQSASDPTADGRQPLPSSFALRWINGGTGDFGTEVKIWREAGTGLDAACADYASNETLIQEVVAFDDDENAEGYLPGECIVTCIGVRGLVAPSTSLTNVHDASIFPMEILREVTSGWIYLNLDDGFTSNGALQAWVNVSRRAEGRYSVEMAAAALGNGCSALADKTEYSEGTRGTFPGPAEDVKP